MKVTDSPEGVARLIGEIPGSPAEVYRYFTEASLLTQWWPIEATVDVRTDGEYELAWPSQGTRLLGQYLVVEPAARLVFTWSFAHEPTAPRTVDLVFSATDGSTRLVIEHTHGPDRDERQGYIDGWKYFIERLRSILSDTR